MPSLVDPQAAGTSPPDWGRPPEALLGTYTVDGPDGQPAELKHRALSGDQVTPTQLQQMDGLLQRTFHGWPAFDIAVPSSEHLRWKIEGPGRWVNSVRLTEGSPGIVGLGIDTGRELRIQGVDVLGEVGADSSVDPAWQSRGVAFGRRQRNRPYRRARYAMMFGTTAHPERVRRRPEHRQLGNPMRVLVHIVNPWRLAATWQRATGRRVPRPVLAAALGGYALASLPARLARGRAPELELREAKRFDERADELFEQAAASFDFIVTRRHDYLNWRYADPRAGSFRIVFAEQGGSLLGYAVTRVDGDRGYLVDLLAPPHRGDVLDALIGDALSRMRADGVSGILCWLVARHPYRRHLRRYGFFDSRRNPNFTHSAAGLPESEIAFMEEPEARIHLMHGDMDVI